MSEGFEILAQLGPSNMLGPQKDTVRALEKGKDVMLGTVIGQFTGLSYRHNPQDDSKPAIALVGPVSFVPADGARPELRATRCFLPGAVHEQIVLAMLGDRPAPIDKSPGRKDKPIEMQLGHVMPFAMEVGARSAPETAVGYVYVTKLSSKIAVKLTDPLEALKGELGIKALPAPRSDAPVALPAPKKSTKKGR